MSRKEAPLVPIGTPARFENRDYLPAIEVGNTAVYVNDDMRFPFAIEKGKRCNLGWFLTAARKTRRASLPLTMMNEHNRSGLLLRVVFEDRQGRRYRDVNLKGIGGSGWAKDSPSRIVLPPETKAETPGDIPYGLCRLSYAEHDRDMTEKFIAKGLRTHRTVAILALNEIVTGNGKRISVATAREKGLLKKDETPAIQVRAFRGTQARITNVRDNGYAFLKDGRKLVAQELGRSRITRRTYLEWFAKTLGEQLAILHSENHSHGFITDHNITLDCTIADFDSVVEMTEKNRAAHAQEDLEGAFECLGELRDAVCGEAGYEAERIVHGIPSYAELDQLFFGSYTARMKNSALLADAKFKTWMTREQSMVMQSLRQDERENKG